MKKKDTILNLVRCICFLTCTLSASNKAYANITLTVTATNVSGPVRYTSGITYDGRIAATATGGTAPYTYSIGPNSTQNNGYYPELTAGTYTVTATDANGQQASTTITVSSSKAAAERLIAGHPRPA